ncbi:MAG: hypothetical protein ACFFKA_16165 [Candidatus Thorarchaeota archaeon]
MAITKPIKKIEEAFDDNYQDIKRALDGLKDILKINFLENNIYYKCAMDNIQAIYTNVIEILNTLYTPRRVRIKLRELNIEIAENQESYPK